MSDPILPRYSDTPPPGGACVVAVWRGGYIVGWEPCNPSGTGCDPGAASSAPTPPPWKPYVPKPMPPLRELPPMDWYNFYPPHLRAKPPGWLPGCLGGVVLESLPVDIGISTIEKGVPGLKKWFAPYKVFSTGEMTFDLTTCVLDWSKGGVN